MGGKHNQGELLPCTYCGTKVYIPPYRVKSFKFCSRQCSYQWKAKNETAVKQCLICDTAFSVIKHRNATAKYCSDKCRLQALKGRGKTVFTCHHCGKEFCGPKSTKRKFCSRACVNKSSKETFQPSYMTVRKMMLSRNLINACETCGFNSYPQVLGVHHRDRNRNNNDLSNLAILCPTCHSIEHMKHIVHGFNE